MTEAGVFRRGRSLFHIHAGPSSPLAEVEERKMLRKSTVLLLSAAAASFVPLVSQGAAIFSDNFNVDSSANWNINKAVINASNVSVTLASSDPSSSAEFAYDYSAMGIPVAPNSGDASTMGLRLRSNLGAVSSVNGATQKTCGISVSPTGQSFSGAYQIQY